MDIWGDKEFVKMMAKVKEVTTRLKVRLFLSSLSPGSLADLYLSSQVPLVMAPSFNPAELFKALDLDPAVRPRRVFSLYLVRRNG